VQGLLLNLKALVHSSSAGLVLIGQEVLLHQCLAVFDIVQVPLQVLIFNVGPRQKSVISLFFAFGHLLALESHLRPFALTIGLHATNSHFEEFVLPFSIQCLLVEEFLLVSLLLKLLFPVLDIVVQVNELFLVVYSVVSQLVNGQLQVGDSLVLVVVTTILIIKAVNELPELLFLLFDVDVVRLEVFVLLAA